MPDDSTTPTHLPPGRCPVCGGPNACRMETGDAYKGACWCEGPVVSAAALRRILGDLPEPRCLCAACLHAIGENPEITREELVARSKSSWL